MKTVYFHIGQTKTATTTLQAFFFQNRNWLEERDVFYPPVPEENPLKMQHRFLLTSIVERKGDYSIAQRYWDDLNSQINAADRPKVLISEETFWHLFEQDLPRRSEAIHWIGQQFKDYDVRIICYLRRQDRWIESWYNQIVKTDVNRASKLSILDFVNRYNEFGLLDYHAVLNDWTAEFGKDKIVVRPFEPGRFLNGDIVQDFCNVLGITDMAGATYPDDQQVSLTNYACEFSSIYNRASRAANYKQQMVKILSEFSGDKSDRRRYLPANIARELLERYSPSNRLVAERFLGPGNELFMDLAVHDAAQDYPGISANELSRIVIEIFIEQQSQIRQLQRRLREIEPRSEDQV
jgi:hypothetical protein